MIVLAPIFVIVPIVIYAYPMPVAIEALLAAGTRAKHPVGFITPK